MYIPTYEDAVAQAEAGNGTALTEFVLHNEPAGPQEAEFRAQLGALIEYVEAETLFAATAVERAAFEEMEE